MTSEPAIPHRLNDLLADRATVGLTAAEADELSTLLTRWPHVDPNEFDRAAAALSLAGDPDPVPVPPDLMAKLEAAAAAHFARPAEPRRPRRAVVYWAVGGWACAAALLVGLLHLQFGRTAPTVAQKRDRLAADPTAARYASAAKPDAAAGNVVFSAAKQEGYMELRGMTPNDPTKSQYQLWVVDTGRPFKEPVDGGVFDVNPDGTALVPVRSPLTLKAPAVFAVTVEPPGGVVVSEGGKEGRFVVAMTPAGAP